MYFVRAKVRLLLATAMLLLMGFGTAPASADQLSEKTVVELTDRDGDLFTGSPDHVILTREEVKAVEGANKNALTMVSPEKNPWPICAGAEVGPRGTGSTASTTTQYNYFVGRSPDGPKAVASLSSWLNIVVFI